jgi:hypothetical protein
MVREILNEQATATADSCGMTNKRTGNGNSRFLRNDKSKEQATATADSCGMTNQRTGNGNSEDKCRSFDCVAHKVP